MAEHTASPSRSAPPKGPLAWIGQVLLYALFAVAIGVFSHWPRYHPLAPGEAVIKVSFIHTGKPVGDCRPLTKEELARLPPNMRTPTICPRERSPVTLQLVLDGRTVLERSALPSGLHKDGASAMYTRLVVPAGEQRIGVRVSDDVRAKGPTYEREARVNLVPGQVLVIDFDPTQGGVTLQ
ncbi:MAG: hypothetical protein KGL78_09665 [Burkholderiales bacterium]|nr:hypothetical protein [Burkholderiales bacterium]